MSGSTNGIPLIPFWPFPSSSVQVASGGITAASIAAGALAGRIVTSVQYGVITLAGGATSATATITAVGARAVLLFLGASVQAALSPPATYGQVSPSNMAYLTLTNATTVTATRLRGSTDNDGMAVSGYVSFCVIDFP